jgi:hypothetical protein
MATECRFKAASYTVLAGVIFDTKIFKVSLASRMVLDPKVPIIFDPQKESVLLARSSSSMDGCHGE